MSAIEKRVKKQLKNGYTMAEKRMFSNQIIDSDAFLDMPATSQNLYFHLSMRADDEGFINSPKKIMRSIGANENDFDVLVAKGFLIGFESKIYVIKHWWVHNYIRQDRVKNTNYTQEKAMLNIKENGVYTLCQSSVSQVADKSQASIEEIRLGKSSIEETRVEEIKDFDQFWKAYPKKEGKGQAEKAWLKVSKAKDFPQMSFILTAIERYKQTDTVTKGFIKNPSTWINGKCWLDEVATQPNCWADDEVVDATIEN